MHARSVHAADPALTYLSLLVAYHIPWLHLPPRWVIRLAPDGMVGGGEEEEKKKEEGD